MEPVPWNCTGLRARRSWSRVSSATSTRPIIAIASRPSAGRLPCAARPCVVISAQANPLCPTATRRSVGSVTMAMSARQSLTSASAPRLMCSSSTTAATISRPRDHRRREDPGGGNHRGHAALHVLRAAPVQPAVRFTRRERMLHAFHADRIDVAAEHQRRSGCGAIEHADHVGPAGRHLLHHHVEPRVPHRRAADVCRGGLACGARHERGIHRIRGDEIAEDGKRIHGTIIN